ncbi:DNA polymerase/3'-5' exonuclease PolX [Ktedonosporobacter rubrisoli]|uniref:DNA polymerase beta n=1 Tax=Ktedonosporobacter rubrisoli TaxID=2509675 RepID=A0A4P6JZ78_KTERU|nr:DNA polymerase/3'-5' exonuclease PolX [Ktedonosporobacter rubrisoli]QBD81059.1 DNA polymerase/3'-5' exonuclease PolX [Ktedonosporobacter rubrisoli]
MDKSEVIQQLEDTATLLALKENSSVFEARAYENAARALGTLNGDIEQLVSEGKLKGTPGLGPTLIKRIEEMVTTGRFSFLEELRASTPAVKIEMLRIPGMGPKRINTIYDQVHVNSIAELEQACKDNKIAVLPGFGKKTQDKILQGIAFMQEHANRFLYSVGEQEAEQIRTALAKLPQIVRLQVAGSLRRRRETVKDIDMVVSVADDAGSDVRNAIMDFFTSQPSVKAITGKGETKASVILSTGIAMDLRVVGDSQFPYTLHHFTGSREHHIPLRRRALSLNMTINDYGLFKVESGKEELVPCKDEKDIYAALGMEYIEPELREDTGEIEAAIHKQLPVLVQESDLRGVIHAHTTWSDGKNSLREMAEACMARGFSYVGITDHSKIAAYAGGLSEDDLRRQGEEIDRLNEEFAGRFRILKGTECDILRDGSLDFSDEALASLDFVIASIHSIFNLPPAEQTQRMIRAISNPYVDIIGHPTGRILLGREGYTLDMEAVIEAAAKHGTCIEINANPLRLDLDWRHLHRARDLGMKIPIGPDAHNLAGLDDMRYGIGVARKGWLRASDVLNTLETEPLLQFFHSRRSQKK